MAKAGLKLAVIGAGRVAEPYLRHLARLRLDGLPVEVAVIASRSGGTASALAARFGIATVAADADRAIGHAGIDAVVVLTGIDSHAGIVARALAAGRHVYVEKPLAANAADAADLMRRAQAAGCVLSVAPQTGLSPAYRKAARAIHDNAIGRIVSARALYGWVGPDWSETFYQDGGGPLRDLGVYALTTLTGLIGPVRSVFAMARTSIPLRAVAGRPFRVTAPDNYQLLLDFGNDCLGVVTSGYVHQKHDVPGIEIYGSEGTIQFIGQDWDPKGVKIWSNADACWRGYDMPGHWPWTDGIRDFCAAILRARPPSMHVSHAVHVADIIDKAELSCRTGRAEPVTSGFTPPQLAEADMQTHRDHDTSQTVI